MSRPAQTQTKSSPQPEIRRRILDGAYDLFSEPGVRAVGIDEAIMSADVQSHPLSPLHLEGRARARFLQRRTQRWTHEWLAADATRRGSTPKSNSS